MSFTSKDNEKLIMEPISPDDIPLVEGESAIMKVKSIKRKSPTKNKSQKSKKIKTSYEYISESDTDSDSSIDDYEKNILLEMESGRGMINPPSNVAPYEFSMMMEGDKFAQERGLTVIKPILPHILNEHLYGPHPNALDSFNKIHKFFNSIQLQYCENEDCFVVEWDGVNVFASTPVLSYKKIYVIDYYFHIIGDILNNSNKSYIISGPSGVGKSQMILFIIAYIRTLPQDIRPALYIKTVTHEFTLYIEEQIYVIEKEENIRAVIEIIDSVSNFSKTLSPFGKRIEITNGNTFSYAFEPVVYYLQRWTKDDITRCMRIISNPPATPLLNWNEIINTVYEKVGGIIKYIIVSTTLNYDIDKEINDSLECCKKNNLPVYYSWNNNNNNYYNNMIKYADKSGIMYEDFVDENYHLFARSIYNDTTVHLTKNPVVKDFYNIFRRFIKLSNWKDMILVLIGFNTVNNNLMKYEVYNNNNSDKNELFDSPLPIWLINAISKENILPDMIFYSHYMVFTLKTDKKTYSILYIYPEGIITSRSFSSYDLIFYPSSMLCSVFTRNSQLKKESKIVKYEYEKILQIFPDLITPFGVLDREITSRQKYNLRSLPTVKYTSIKEEEEMENGNNYNNIRNQTVYFLTPATLKSAYQTFRTFILLQNSVYYNYFEMIINNTEWQQILFNLCRIIYISPHIELKLVLFYYLYKRGCNYLIVLHFNNESGYIKAIYDTFGDEKSFVSTFNSKINLLRNIYPSLPKVLLIEQTNQSNSYH